MNMESKESIAFLFDITKEIKRFYESPVIFLTKKDYTEVVFNTMCHIRANLETINVSPSADTLNYIVGYHLEWLHDVKDIENFKKRFKDIEREEVYQAISYTIDALAYRYKSYQIYVDKHRPKLPALLQANMKMDLEILDDMNKEVTKHLLETLTCFRSHITDDEFHIKLSEAIENLFNWLDKIYDNLAMQISKYINVNVPHLSTDLTRTLQQIVNELKHSETSAGKKVLKELEEKGREISSMIRLTADRTLEVRKVVEKINVLEDRIKRLGGEPTSAAVMALTHKKNFLEKRLESIENLRVTLKTLEEQSDVKFENVKEDDLCVCEDFYQLRIFNHSLPPEERERLVTELCYLWDLAVFGDKTHKSIISILSASEVKEEYTDEIGTFYVDSYSRKIYKLPDDDTLYQANEHQELVPLNDDAEHIYYYDECGRYFIDPKSRQRIYKDHDTASEYMLDPSGMLMKTKEERDGVTYYYDSFGRYYINEEGKNIYRDVDAVSEYESDGLGNLIRIRSQLDIFALCPDDAHVTEDFKYLKLTVGAALRKCIADVIVHQPADPIKYLSASLIKYRQNMELKENRAQEQEALSIERNIRFEEERAAAERAALEAALLAQGGSEASYDSNLLQYSTMAPDDPVEDSV